MVDIDKLKNESGSSGSSKKKKKKDTGSSNNQTQSSGGGEVEPHTTSKDEMMDPSNKVMGEVAKDWAEDGADLNFDQGTGGGFGSYKKNQIQEVQELHQNIYEMATDNMENFDEFTLYFHALFFNLAQNRVGIVETLQSEFGMDKQEALEKTEEICSSAGEKKLVRKVLRDMTKNLAEM